MTGLSAVNFNLTDRGHIRPGAFADIVVFDPKTIIDTATYENPCQPAIGINAVLVNGVVVQLKECMTGAKPGHLLRRGLDRIPRLKF